MYANRRTVTLEASILGMILNALAKAVTPLRATIDELTALKQCVSVTKGPKMRRQH